MNCRNSFLVAVVLLLLLPITCRADRYALLIGIDKYRDKSHNLNSCIADIHGVASALQTTCGYRPENIEMLVGEGKTKVTRQEILDATAHFAERIKPDDTIFFFWSGHGAFLDNEDYVMPYDLNPHNEATYRGTILSVREMIAPLVRVRSKALLLFFNMCRADAAGQVDLMSSAVSAASQPMPDKSATTATGPQQKVALYSSIEGQLSIMWLAKHRSFFGYYLEKGLQGAAADAKGEIHAENLIGYVRKAVPAACWREGYPVQRPYAITSGLEADRWLLTSGLPAGKGGATAVPSVVGDSVDARFEAAFQAGAELWDQGRYEEARVHFEEATQLRPTDVQVIGALGHINRKLNRLDDAERYYRKAMEIWPKSDDLVTVLADIYYARKDYVTAENLYRKAIAMNPKGAVAYFDLGNLYANIKHDDSNALSCFFSSFERDPTNPNALNAIGNIYSRRKDYIDAEKTYRKIIAVHPDYSAALANLAYILFVSKNDLAESERLYLKAIDLDPTQSWIENGLGWLYYTGKRDYPAAEKHFRKAMELDPENMEPVTNLANMDCDRKDYGEAEKLYRKAIACDGSNGLFHASLAACLIMEKQMDTALMEAKKAMELGYKETCTAFMVLGLKPR